RGIANNMANKAALSVPIDSGTRPVLASEASLPEDACQLYSGADRPSYQTLCHRELIELSGRIIHTSADSSCCFSSITSRRLLIGEIARWRTAVSVTDFINNEREEVP